MSDLYTAPQATVDDGVVDRRARRNAIAGFASSLATVGSLVIYLGGTPPANDVIDWIYYAVATLSACAITGMVMAVFPKVRWPWICLVAPFFALLVLAAGVSVLAFVG